MKHRCWGIGLGRTGTHSLCDALQILGYKNVIHNPTFEQLRIAGAGADNGVTIYFKYLDYKYPNSKFVLTMRGLEDWLESIQYISEKHPVPPQDNDEIIKRRMLIYEAVEYDHEKFTRAYIRHYDEVRRYFRDRPTDLLEMNMMAGDGWEKLCPFLGLPVPAAPFPHSNRRS
jgi:hypothetical protein